MTNNRRAFLATIAVSEGTSTSPATDNDGYDVIVTGNDGIPEVFTLYKDHPFATGRKPKTISRDGKLKSTASGRYQLLYRWWKPYKKMLGLTDFSPASQDAVAIQQIKERGALADIDAGRFDEAVAKCCNIWASLPGAGYGQHENKLEKLREIYLKEGGELA